MAIKQINCCDRCGATCQHDTIYVETGNDGHKEPVDLCASCTRAALVELVERMGQDSSEAGKMWVEKWRQPRPPVRM